MAIGIQCNGNQNVGKMESPQLIVIFCVGFFLAILVALLGILTIIRKYIEMRDIRVEMPEGLRDITQTPVKEQFYTKSVQLHWNKESSYVNL